jgi:SAM-dependent methyltransferase
MDLNGYELLLYGSSLVCAMRESRLYSGLDIIGRLLSEWRSRAVLPYVGGNLLDLACGDNRLVRKYGAGTGVDIVPYQNVDVVCHDFSRLPFRDDEFDTITILAALNYFDDPGKVLREVRRIMKPDGTLLVTFLNRQVSKIWHRFRERDITPRPAFSEAELTSCVQSADMRIVQKRKFMFGVNVIYFIGRESWRR